MNLRRPPKQVPFSVALLKDVARIEQAWADARRKFGKGGPFLFGKFSLADAMYAPVVTRFLTYDVALDATCNAYGERIMAWPDMAEWVAEAKREPEDIDELEVEF